MNTKKTRSLLAKNRNAKISLKIIAIMVAVTVAVSSVGYYLTDRMATSYANIVNMPLTQSLSTIRPSLSQKAFHLPIMRGIQVNPDDPNDITFYFDTMDKSRVSKKDINRMIGYFLGFLTIPKEKIWVNLSPYEKDRMIPDVLSKLNIGKDMLIEDYLLKQISSSATDPKTPQGKKFWEKVRKICYQHTKTSTIPVDTFNKIWVVPEKAIVIREGSKVFVKSATLKVMLEEDYYALNKNRAQKILGEKQNTVCGKVRQEVKKNI